jgi:ribosomal protein S20
MSVSPISSSAANPYQAPLVDAFKQRGQDFKALGTALQSGDLAGAQQAFAALQKDTQTIQSAQSQPSGQNSPGSQDFKTLESALNSGDLSGAQKAFATVQQDVQTARKSHGGHGHHVHQAPAPQSTTQTDTDGTSSILSTGTNTNLSA